MTVPPFGSTNRCRSPLKESLQEHVDDVEMVARERLQKISATFH